jgi:hypothetical protein
MIRVLIGGFPSGVEEWVIIWIGSWTHRRRFGFGFGACCRVDQFADQVQCVAQASLGQGRHLLAE